MLTKILAAACLSHNDHVLEIGAGTGILTRALADRVERLVAIELDDGLFERLQSGLANRPNVELVHGNALDLDPCPYFQARPYTLVGNIPYYITGPLLRHYLACSCRASRLVVMVQWEVAQRIVARPGAMSLLAVSVQYYATARIFARVPASAFFPRPKVDSAILQLLPHGASANDVPETDLLFTVARAGFGTRRKQLVNALAHGLSIEKGQAREMLSVSGVATAARAQDLDLAHWATLAHAYGAMIGNPLKISGQLVDAVGESGSMSRLLRRS